MSESRREGAGKGAQGRGDEESRSGRSESGPGAAASREDPDAGRPPLMVGIGASAGGLEAHLRSQGRELAVAIEVIPQRAHAQRCDLVLFDARPLEGVDVPAGAPSEGGEAQDHLLQLQKELSASRESLQSIIQDLEAANEELRLLNSDLINLLDSVEIAIVMVDQDLFIRRFTPMAEGVLNLIRTDIGRPIAHNKPNADVGDIEQLMNQAVDSVMITEREVRDREGRWYALRVRPYKSVDDRIEGAVMRLDDIHDRKAQEQAVGRALELAEALVEVAANPLAVLDRDLRVMKVNRAFRRVFDVSADECLGRRLSDVREVGWDEATLRELLASVLEGETEPVRVERVQEPPRLGPRRPRMEARRVPDAEGHGYAFVLACNVSQEAP